MDYHQSSLVRWNRTYSENIFRRFPMVHARPEPCSHQMGSCSGQLKENSEGELRTEAFFCTNLEATAIQILQWFILRWNIEVTFEEARAHLGVET